MDNNWQIEHLIKSAFNRTKTRFLSYFLTIILNFCFWIAFILLICLSFGICYLLYMMTNSVIAVTLLGSFLVIILTILAVYLGSWMQLTIISILTQEERLGVVETFKKTKPLVNGYLWFVTIYSFFILGLFPLGFLSLFIIIILWSFWGSFSMFVYLDKRKKGLENLWTSRSMINQKFWPIAGRMLLITFAVTFISMILSSSKNVFLSLSTILLSIFTTPFIISFNYEMYKSLAEPENIKKPKVWIVFSVIGGVIMIVVLASLYIAAINYVINLKSNPLPTIPFNYSLPFPSLPVLPNSI